MSEPQFDPACFSSDTSTGGDSLTRIPLEKIASVRKQLKELADDWISPDFIVGPSNLGLNYLFDPDQLKNFLNLSPVLIFGDQRVGKTAISATLAGRWSKVNKRRPVCLITGKEYAQSYAAAVEIDDIESFRKKVRGCQILVIDDIHGMAGKAACQDELMHNLDQLSLNGSPCIITSDRLPSTSLGYRPGLVSRLLGGYSLTLVSPALPELIAIGQVCGQSLELDEHLEVIESVIRRLTNHKLTAYDVLNIAKLTKQTLSANGFVDEGIVFELALQHQGAVAPSLASISKTVARRMRVRFADMRGSTREANIVRARGLAIFLARRLTAESLQQIGSFFGGRDHSTVLHACRKTERLIESDTELASLRREIEAELLRE